jgi:hypothetical protein
MDRAEWQHLVIDFDSIPNLDMPDGYGIGDSSRASLEKIREAANTLNDCGFLYASEYDIMSDIIERCETRR